jgi:hypothetical protein
MLLKDLTEMFANSLQTDLIIAETQGQQITIYRLKPVDGEILIEESGTVIYVIVRN